MTVDMSPARTDKRDPTAAENRPASRWRPIVWLAGGMALTFLVSFTLADVLELQHDLYLLVYVTAALGYLGWFTARSGVWQTSLFQQHIWWSLVVGVCVGVTVAAQVLSGSRTDHPDGAYFGFELVWRGLVYGSVDALVLAVFPAAVAYLVMGGRRRGARRRVAFAALTVLFSLAVSTAYHVGYPTYRNEQLRRPLIGTVMWDLPAVLTGNPVGAVVAHAGVHTTAVVTQYHGGEDRLLPPELNATYSERAGGDAAPALAAGWLLLVGSVLLRTRGRWARSDPRSDLGEGGDSDDGDA